MWYGDQYARHDWPAAILQLPAIALLRGCDRRVSSILRTSRVLLSSTGSLLAGELVLGLLVAVRDHAVEKGAGSALGVAISFGLLDLAVQVGGGLFVLAIVTRVVLVEVLGCSTVSVRNWKGCS